MRSYRDLNLEMDLGATEGQEQLRRPRRARRSFSVPRNEQRPKIVEPPPQRQQSLSPVRLREGDVPNPLASPTTPREARDSRLLHRLGYDAGDSGLDRPRVAPPNTGLPAHFPAFIFVESPDKKQPQQPVQQPNVIFEGHPQEAKQDSKLQSPMARSLAESDWPAFHQHLQNLERLSTKDKLLFLRQGTDSSTLLHTAVWKAPPGLLALLLNMLKQDRNDDTRQLFLTLDSEGNTALHLWCANLDSNQAEPSSLLKKLVLGAPQALQVQNSEGDTPLHMFVSSQACCAKKGSLTKEQVETALTILTYMIDISLGETSIAQDSTGATPLHVAIAHGAHEAILLKLLDEAPKAASMADERGMLPLHYAAAFCDKVTAKFVEALINAYPEALTQGTEMEDTPLHILVSNASSSSKNELDSNTAEVIELLMGRTLRKNNPIMATNNENLNPLHCCALFDPPPAVAQYLMKSPISERAACMENDFGATPLHLAAARPTVSDSIGIVEALGTREAAATPDRLKRTPLHVASQNVHATPALIEFLVKLNPDANSTKTQRGHLPLHLAAQSQAKEPVVQALIQAFPKAAETRSKSSNTPLHDAAKYKASPGVVKLLLDAYPDAAYIQNKHNNLPLHCATQYQAPDEVVLMLLEAWPDGASMQNRQENAPLHYAAGYNTRKSTLEKLLKAAPAALLLLNGLGESPMDRAKAGKAPPDILKLLEESMAEWNTNKADPSNMEMFQQDFEGSEF